MVQPNDEAKRPASNNEDATPSARSSFKLKDGPLSVTVFAKSKGKGEVHLFVVPERAYRNKDKKWVSTHLLHEEDLLRMSLLLMRTYAQLRHKTEEPSPDSKQD